MFRATRTEGRGPRQAAAIFQATLDLLMQHGYDGLTIEGVAARSKVNKTTIYRWYPSKDALLAAAMIDREVLEKNTEDTGSLRGDLIAVTHQVIRMLTAVPSGKVATAALGGLERPGLAGLVRMFCAERMESEKPIFDRARQRGELTADVDPAMVIDLLAGAVWYRVLIRQTALESGFAEAIVDTVLSGLPRSS
ncbi:TetR/AcrR family transcriptional regulator [Actinocrispum sp. NPDC049592]|uniref:TetR/AcrR family transcriptional regulator n=1 Tax=Actinocrispum sp. NPDC049592 TaxID=3154835 RepID=UPI0034318779